LVTLVTPPSSSFLLRCDNLAKKYEQHDTQIEEMRQQLKSMQTFMDHRQHQQLLHSLHQELLYLIPAIAPIKWPTATIFPPQFMTKPPPHNLVGTTTTSGFTQCTNQYYFSKLRPPDIHGTTLNEYTHNSFATAYYFSTVRPPDRAEILPAPRQNHGPFLPSNGFLPLFSFNTNHLTIPQSYPVHYPGKREMSPQPFIILAQHNRAELSPTTSGSY
jgi:hypothetical protein